MSLILRPTGYYCQLLIGGNRFNFYIKTSDITAAGIVERTVKHHAKQMLDRGSSPDAVTRYIKAVVADFIKDKTPQETKSKPLKTVSIKKAGLTFKEAADKAYEKHFAKLGTPYHYRTHLNYLEEAAKKVLKSDIPYLCDFTERVISDVRDSIIKDRGISESTANRYMATLRKLLNIMHRELEVITSVPYVKMAPDEVGRVRVITPEEEDTFINFALSKADTQYGEIYTTVCDLFQVLLDTGLRLGEALSLSYSQNIKFELNSIVLGDVTKIKNKKRRSVPLTNRAKEILVRRQKTYDDRPFPITHHRAEMYMRYIKRDLEITDEEFVYHACRHTFASRLVAKRIDLYRIQKLLGHKSIKTTEKYTHLDTDTLQSAVDALN